MIFHMILINYRLISLIELHIVLDLPVFEAESISHAAFEVRQLIDVVL